MPSPEVANFGERVAERLAQELSSDLVGVYFVGSVALGGFVAGQSDIDMVAVSDPRLSGQDKERIAAAIVDVSAQCPARGLEFTLYRGEVARSPATDAGFELNANGGPRMPTAVHLDASVEPAFWYVLDRAIAHRYGLPIFGPPADTVFTEISRRTLLKAMAASMEWHQAHERTTLYSVLNACRAWRFLEEDVLGSKLEGAAWARTRWPEPEVIDAAVALRRGQRATINPAAADGLLSAVAAKLGQAPAD